MCQLFSLPFQIAVSFSFSLLQLTVDSRHWMRPRRALMLVLAFLQPPCSPIGSIVWQRQAICRDRATWMAVALPWSSLHCGQTHAAQGPSSTSNRQCKIASLINVSFQLCIVVHSVSHFVTFSSPLFAFVGQTFLLLSDFSVAFSLSVCALLPGKRALAL